MTAIAGRIDPADARWRHGLQLALAVIVSFGVSALLRLPESFWAVMSALIVVHPTTGSTLGAGWDRVRGTLAGTVIGLAGVWLHHVDGGSNGGTLVVVALVAFASALIPALRSAPISALIVLTSGAIAGHSALDVAGLRAIEIAIGVTTGLLVSMLAFASHARTHFDGAAAAWLRDAAGRVSADLLDATRTKYARDAANESSRNALRELAVLAVGADREQRLVERLRGATRVTPRVMRARLLARTSADLVALVRLATSAPEAIDPDARTRIADACDHALRAMADAIAEKTTTDLRTLHGLSGDRAPNAWLAPTLRLLVQDVAQLRGAWDDKTTETP